jgi:hypothetical protein
MLDTPGLTTMSHVPGMSWPEFHRKEAEQVAGNDATMETDAAAFVLTTDTV